VIARSGSISLNLLRSQDIPRGETLDIPDISVVALQFEMHHCFAVVNNESIQRFLLHTVEGSPE
jgi:hypothetical protein